MAKRLYKNIHELESVSNLNKIHLSLFIDFVNIMEATLNMFCIGMVDVVLNMRIY